MSTATLGKAPKKTKEAEFVVYRLTERNDPKLAKYLGVVADYRPLTFLPHEDVINDKDYGRRAIRYLEGYPTFYVDEQVERKIPDSIVNRGKSIEITDGEVRVHKNNKLLLKYLDICNFNVSNTNRDTSKRGLIYKVDEEAIAKKEAEILDMEEEALLKVRELEDEQLIPLAKFLDIPVIDAVGQGDRDLMSIRNDLRKYARKKPDVFLAAVSNPYVNTAYLIKVALDKKVITLGKVQGQAHFTGTGKLITKIPEGRNAEEFLVDYCYTEEGAEFLVALKGAIK